MEQARLFDADMVVKSILGGYNYRTVTEVMQAIHDEFLSKHIEGISVVVYGELNTQLTVRLTNTRLDELVAIFDEGR